jgi:acetoin utilization protein AcuB
MGLPMNLAQIMNLQVITVGMDDNLQTVQGLFERFGFHHLLVLDKKGTLVGVVSDRDLLKALSPFTFSIMERTQDQRTLRKRVHQIMGRRPVTASEELSIKEAAVLMLDKKISCLPIVDSKGIVKGIVTHRDILKWLVEQMWSVRGDSA